MKSATKVVAVESMIGQFVDIEKKERIFYWESEVASFSCHKRKIHPANL